MSLGLVRPRRPGVHRTAVFVSAAMLCLGLTACQSESSEPTGGRSASTGDTTSSSSSTGGGGNEADEVPAASVRTSVRPGATGVAVDTPVDVQVSDGTLTKVRVTSPAGDLAGSMNKRATSWASSDGLEPGVSYDVQTVAEGSDGAVVRDTSTFTTQALTLDQQTYPSVAPLGGETVGVGMPVVVRFDVPVTDRANVEKHMSVTTAPQQRGTWHWLSDYEAHYRPASYWKPGTSVDVDVDVNGVDAGNGIYGQEDRKVAFDVGDAHVYKVDAATHQMRVFSNGTLLRTIPITTGKAGFTTRSGTKVIVEKFESKTMNSETVGIDNDSSEGYNIDNVQYAMRLTYTGEFIHAAPWSVSSQGVANVSHGCTGMSTENAGWLFDMTLRGDVVEYTGTDRPMTLDNGYGDWNESFAEYKQGSALG